MNQNLLHYQIMSAFVKLISSNSWSGNKKINNPNNRQHFLTKFNDVGLTMKFTVATAARCGSTSFWCCRLPLAKCMVTITVSAALEKLGWRRSGGESGEVGLSVFPSKGTLWGVQFPWQRGSRSQSPHDDGRGFEGRLQPGKMGLGKRTTVNILLGLAIFPGLSPFLIKRFNFAPTSPFLLLSFSPFFLSISCASFLWRLPSFFFRFICIFVYMDLL